MFAKPALRKLALAILIATCLLQAHPANVSAREIPAVANRMSAEDIYEQTLRGTVLIAIYDQENKPAGKGTGWVADVERGFIVTNHHVASRASQIHVYFPQYKDGELLTDLDDYRFAKPAVATIVDTDRTLDLAVLHVPAMPANTQALELAAGSAKPASNVHTIGGQPRGTTGVFSYSSGAVRQVQDSGTNAYGNRLRTVETNLTSNRGNSGGAIVNDAGQVVGVVSKGSFEEGIANVVVSGVDVKPLRSYLEMIKDLSLLDTPEKNNLMGVRHLADGRSRAAVQLFSRAIDMDSTVAVYFENRATAFHMANDNETAMINVNKAIDMNAGSGPAFEIRASIHAANGDHKAAIADWTRAISINPTAKGYGERGVARKALKSYQSAVEDLSRAIQMDPVNNSFKTQRALAYIELNQLDKAMEDATKAVEQDANDHRAFNVMGFVMFKKQDFELAFRGFQAAYEINPRVAQYQINAGLALANLGEFQTAVKWYDAALQLEPNNTSAKQARKTALSQGQPAQDSRTVTRRVSNQASHPLIGTWALNNPGNSGQLNEYITLGADGRISGVVRNINPDQTLNEQIISGTWSFQSNQLTLTSDQGAPMHYHVELSGQVLRVFQNGHLQFTYRKIG